MTEFNLIGKVFIVTGANAGIGFATSKLLAQAGASVVMACRNLERGETAKKRVIAESGSNLVELGIVDLSSLSSIRNFVREFESKYSQLHGLINNAANFDISAKQPSFTLEGAEVIFATNHLGPFLLTNLLLDRLKASAPSRVVNISSMGLLTYPRMQIDFDGLTTSKKRKYSPQYAYYHSKLAQVMFTRQLAKHLEGSGVCANAIRVPNVRIDTDRYPNLSPLMLKMYAIKQRFAITPEQMAHGYLKIAASPEFEGISGQYFDERGKTVKFPKASLNDVDCEKLWKLSSEMTGS
jgi:NAD(P)-dependent dehydrogenase (short-subunit alcohol dehydrogenase family)